jgi:hypothetical protein
VKEFAVERFISLGRGFEPMGAMKWDDIVDEILKALKNVEESRHGVLDERRLCVLGCIIDVSKRANGPAGFTKIMDCLKTSCGLKHRDYFYRYVNGLEGEGLVASMSVSRGKSLYAPTIRGVVIYNVALTLKLMEVDPQAFIPHAIVMLGFLRLLPRAREDVLSELFSKDENLAKFFMETIDHVLNALAKKEDVSQTLSFLTRRIVTVNGEEVKGFDLVEYLTNVVVNLHLVCIRGVVEYLNLDNFLKINKALDDLRNNEPASSQG